MLYPGLYYKTFYGDNFCHIIKSKIQSFPLLVTSSLVQYLQERVQLIRVEPLTGPNSNNCLTGLPSYFRLGWKFFILANTLACYVTTKTTALKVLQYMGQSYKKFTAVIYEFSYQVRVTRKYQTRLESLARDKHSSLV